MRYSTQKNKGFTLIELLVVISIIGLLSSVILASLTTARAKGRDGQRLENVRSIRVALELYRDKYGYYPDSTGCNLGATDGTTVWCKSSDVQSGHWIRDSKASGRTLGEFLAVDPVDPQQISSQTVLTSATLGNFLYFSLSSGNFNGNGANNWYLLRFALENPSATLEAGDGTYAPDGTCYDYGQTNNGVKANCTSGTQNNNGDISWGPLGGI